jgi:hypothetical protein
MKYVLKEILSLLVLYICVLIKIFLIIKIKIYLTFGLISIKKKCPKIKISKPLKEKKELLLYPILKKTPTAKPAL